MTASAPALPHDLRIRQVSRARRVRNRIVSALLALSLLAAIVPLAFVVYYVVTRGAGILSLDFFTERIPSSRRRGPGMGPAVVGTLLTTGAATAIAVPLGILGAIYNSEYGESNRIAGVIRFMADVMAGVPSVVMGLFVYTAWVLRFREQTAFAGALALACLMLPIVIRSTEAMLRLVPADLREASYALGCRKSRTILTVVLPAALPGVTSGALLAVARAAGETAPLLFTIGAVQEVNARLFEGANTALSVQIFRNAQLPFEGAQTRAWGAALTLILLVLVLTALARAVSARFTVR